jgi:hypothetical protein
MLCFTMTHYLQAYSQPNSPVTTQRKVCMLCLTSKDSLFASLVTTEFPSPHTGRNKKTYFDLSWISSPNHKWLSSHGQPHQVGSCNKLKKVPATGFLDGWVDSWSSKEVTYGDKRLMRGLNLYEGTIYKAKKGALKKSTYNKGSKGFVMKVRNPKQ